MMEIGFIGLGRMGYRMAKKLHDAGFPLMVWNRSLEKSQNFHQHTKALIADNPKQLAENTDVVLTMLANDAASEQVYYGQNGLFEANEGAQYFIEMGTLSPDHIRRIAQTAKKKNKILFDAPVSGATQAAMDGLLLFMLGTDEKTAAPLLPIFNVMGKHNIFFNDVALGSVMKLSINMLIHGLNQTISEALNLAESSGININKAYDAIEASAAAAPMLKYRRPLYIDDQSHDVMFSVSLAEKDMGLALQEAMKNHLFMPQSRINHQILQQAIQDGYDQKDMAAIIHYIKEKQGDEK